MKGNGKFEALIAKWSMEGVEICPTCRRDMTGVMYDERGAHLICEHCLRARTELLIDDVLKARATEEGE